MGPEAIVCRSKEKRAECCEEDLIISPFSKLLIKIQQKSKTHHCSKGQPIFPPNKLQDPYPDIESK